MSVSCVELTHLHNTASTDGVQGPQNGRHVQAITELSEGTTSHQAVLQHKQPQKSSIL